MDAKSIKGSQFVQPLLEFSGACAGCGETPYARLVTQLFGDRMVILTQQAVLQSGEDQLLLTPYTKNAEGKGPCLG